MPGTPRPPRPIPPPPPRRGPSATPSASSQRSADPTTTTPPVKPVGRPPVAPEDALLRITKSCAVRLDEIRWRFAPSSGPGGQHANKASTRAEARLDLAASPSLTDTQRQRLTDKLGPVVTVAVDDTRSQGRNRTLALERLRARLASALERPPPRRATKPSRGAKERRLDSKRRRGEIKKGRRSFDE